LKCWKWSTLLAVLVQLKGGPLRYIEKLRYFLRGITDNNWGRHSRCFRDTLAVCNRISIRVRVIITIIISTTISTVSIASSTSSYSAVGVLIIVIIIAAGAMRVRRANTPSLLLGLGFIERFRFKLFRICENWVIASGFGVTSTKSTGSNNSTGITNMDMGHGVHKVISRISTRRARFASLRASSSFGLSSRLLVRVVNQIGVQIARSRLLSSSRNRGVLEEARVRPVSTATGSVVATTRSGATSIVCSFVRTFVPVVRPGGTGAAFVPVQTVVPVRLCERVLMIDVVVLEGLRVLVRAMVE